MYTKTLIEVQCACKEFETFGPKPKSSNAFNQVVLDTGTKHSMLTLKLSYTYTNCTIAVTKLDSTIYNINCEFSSMCQQDSW